MHVSHVCLRLSPLSMPDPSKVKHGYKAKLISLGKTIYSLTAQRPFSKKILGPTASAGRIISEFWVARILPSV